jgi:CheY-like chemotaxis protein
MRLKLRVPASLVAGGRGQTVDSDYRAPDGKRRSRENRSELALALISLVMLFGVIYFAEIDDSYRTSTTITAAIQRLLGGHPARAQSPRRAPSGPTAILVTENDDGQRLIAKTALEHSGYAVVLVENGAEAAALLRKDEQSIALMVLDRAALGSHAAQTVRRLKSIRPDVPILVSQARGENALPDSRVAGSIEKPFSALPLAAAVEKALAAK